MEKDIFDFGNEFFSDNFVNNYAQIYRAKVWYKMWIFHFWGENNVGLIETGDLYTFVKNI